MCTFKKAIGFLEVKVDVQNGHVRFKERSASFIQFTLAHNIIKQCVFVHAGAASVNSN